MKRVLILGNSANGIYYQMIDHFLARNTMVFLIKENSSPDFSKKLTISKLIKVIAPSEYLTVFDKVLLKSIPVILSYIDLAIFKFYYKVFRKKEKLKKLLECPPLKRPVSNMLLYAKIINRIDVDYVLCLNVYFYGLCSIFVKRNRVVAQPWGSDVNRYGLSSPLRFFLVKKSLQSSAFVAPAGKSVIPFMIDSYSLKPEKVIFLPPVVDSSIFYPLPSDQIKYLRKKFGIQEDAIVFFSCRRFFEGWGPSIIKSLFLKLANTIPNSFYIVLSGSANNRLIDEFENELPVAIKGKFLFVKEEISLQEFALFSQISDFTVSAMTNRDMRSSSILQSAASGAYPILYNQEEYKLLVNDGLSALLFDSTDDDLFFSKLKNLIADKDQLSLLKKHNHGFFNSHKGNSYVDMLNSLF